MKFSLLISALLVQFMAAAQLSTIEWQETIGGSGPDQLVKVIPTADGGYFMAGYSSSDSSGDKTHDSKGSLDFWLVKLDAGRNIEWQKTIGGASFDQLNDAIEVSAGGYLLGGTSNSNISGDKTEKSNSNDYWIIKIDQTGNILWQNTLGGSGHEFLNKIAETPDGGFLLAGSSLSGASFDKTEPSRGQTDYWLVKLNASGSISWQKTIGGDGTDNVGSMLVTSTGDIIVGGESYSDVSGEKTDSLRGFMDFWILKLDNTGNILWQKTLGGSIADNRVFSIIETKDGDYLIGGTSESGISGDKTEPNIGDADLWLIKLTTAGAIDWQKTIGGSTSDYTKTLIATADGGYVLGADTYSDVSGDKTVGNNGHYDFWILKLDATGSITNQVGLGGDKYDYLSSMIATPDGGFILSGSSDSNVSGDKTDSTRGSSDYWVVKLKLGGVGQVNIDYPSFSIYPNPSTGVIYLNTPANSAVEITLHDLTGAVVKRANLEQGEPLDLSQLAKGVYLVKVNANGTILPSKLLLLE